MVLKASLALSGHQPFVFPPRRTEIVQGLRETFLWVYCERGFCLRFFCLYAPFRFVSSFNENFMKIMILFHAINIYIYLFMSLLFSTLSDDGLFVHFYFCCRCIAYLRGLARSSSSPYEAGYTSRSLPDTSCARCRCRRRPFNNE